MGILEALGSIFSPIADIVDNVSTTDEERLQLRNELARIQSELSAKMLELQGKVLESNAKIAVAETTSDSAFTRMYRPLIICGMFILILLHCFGILTNPLPDLFFTVFGASFGVVGVGRTIEKVKKIGGN